MNTDWFTVETVDDSTFVISEYKHWEETHCYLLCGKERALLIDTGLGVADIGEAVDSLTRLPVTAVTTHVHWDHIGGHSHFDTIGVHEAERDWLADRFPIPAAVVRHNLTCRPCRFPEGFDPEKYRVFQGEPQLILHDGDRLDLGDREVTVIHTPGHSPGHCCFYEPERKYLYAGDLIYAGCLDAFYPTTDPGLFWESVKKIRKLDVKRVFPGHHALEIPAELISQVEAGFHQLEQMGKLWQGSGVFEFGMFQIHL